MIPNRNCEDSRISDLHIFENEDACLETKTVNLVSKVNIESHDVSNLNNCTNSEDESTHDDVKDTNDDDDDDDDDDDEESDVDNDKRRRGKYWSERVKQEDFRQPFRNTKSSADKKKADIPASMPSLMSIKCDKPESSLNKKAPSLMQIDLSSAKSCSPSNQEANSQTVSDESSEEQLRLSIIKEMKENRRNREALESLTRQQNHDIEQKLKHKLTNGDEQESSTKRVKNTNGDLDEDEEYKRKMDEQKRKREEFLRIKEEKRLLSIGVNPETIKNLKKNIQQESPKERTKIQPLITENYNRMQQPAPPNTRTQLRPVMPLMKPSLPLMRQTMSAPAPLILRQTSFMHSQPQMRPIVQPHNQMLNQIQMPYLMQHQHHLQHQLQQNNQHSLNQFNSLMACISQRLMAPAISTPVQHKPLLQFPLRTKLPRFKQQQTHTETIFDQVNRQKQQQVQQQQQPPKPMNQSIEFNQTTSTTLVLENLALNTTEKCLLDLCNTICIKPKVCIYVSFIVDHLVFPV